MEVVKQFLDLVTLPGILYTDDEIDQIQEAQKMGLPEPDLPGRPYDFLINPLQVVCLMPGRKRPKTETAVWTTVGENFLATMPIAEVARRLQNPFAK